VPGSQVSSGEIKRKLTDSQRTEVDRHLAEGRGVATYEDAMGRQVLLMTWGDRSADVPGYPPAVYGGASLSAYVPAPKESAPKRSPLMDALGGPPQVARPRVAPSHTEYPDLAMREMPRGRTDGFIDPRRLLPGREPEPVEPPPQPQQPESEYVTWLRQHVGYR
jgi:hypothetical protein